MGVEKERGQKFSPRSHGRQTEIIYGGKREKREEGKREKSAWLLHQPSSLLFFFLGQSFPSLSLPSPVAFADEEEKKWRGGRVGAIDVMKRLGGLPLFFFFSFPFPPFFPGRK